MTEQQSCVPCQRGFYKAAGDPKCIKCSNGKTTEAEGSTSSQDCNVDCGDKFIDSNGNCAACSPD